MKREYQKPSSPNIVRLRSYRKDRTRRLEDIARPDSRWDVCPSGFEQIKPKQVLEQNELQAGEYISGKVKNTLLDALIIAPLTFEHARLNRSLIIAGEARDYTLGLFKSIGLACRPRPTKLKDGRTLVEFDSPKHAAIMLALPGPLKIERPPGLVTGWCESIWSSQDAFILTPDLVPPRASGIELIRDTQGTLLAAIARNDPRGRPLYPVHLEEETILPSRVLVVLNSGVNCEPMLEHLKQLGALSTKTAGQPLPIIYALFPDVEPCAEAGIQLESSEFNGRRIFCGYGNELAYELELWG